MTLRERFSVLARLAGGSPPVVSVYLDTRWTDEHNRDRARVLVKTAVRKARATDAASAEDLDWTEAQVDRLLNGVEPPAAGVALFAGGPARLREVVPAGRAFEDAFVVGDQVYLAPLARLLSEARPSVVVFVDGVSARLIPLFADGPGEEIVLEHQVEGRHRRGGWALLNQSRYRRHIEAQRGHHLDGVAEALGAFVRRNGIERIVIAGGKRAVALFLDHLPHDLAALVVGRIPGARHEAARALAQRAAPVLASHDGAGSAGGRPRESLSFAR
jgi:hypothetical protein